MKCSYFVSPQVQYCDTQDSKMHWGDIKTVTLSNKPFVKNVVNGRNWDISATPHRSYAKTVMSFLRVFKK